MWKKVRLENELEKEVHLGKAEIRASGKAVQVLYLVRTLATHLQLIGLWCRYFLS